MKMSVNNYYIYSGISYFSNSASAVGWAQPNPYNGYQGFWDFASEPHFKTPGNSQG
jgi:hypothetical protein